MKFPQVVVAVLALSLSPLFPVQAHAEETQSVDIASVVQDGFSWKAAHEFVMRCAVQPFAVKKTGEKVYSVLRSVCPELKVTGGFAHFELNGQVFTARVYDSTYSDGGDLNDLEVRNAQEQTVAHATHLPSFGDVILALAGGDDGFRMVYDDTLLAADMAE